MIEQKPFIPIPLPKRPLGSKFICVSSSHTPSNHKELTYNEISTHISRRGSDHFWNRMISSVKELEKI